MPLYNYNKKHKILSRNLRRTQTDAEYKLWSILRGRQLHGFKFRRQHPLNEHILDFYCEEKKLAIELDGSQHLTNENSLKDLLRDKNLNTMGIKTIRFPDTDIFKNLDGVITVIENHLK